MSAFAETLRQDLRLQILRVLALAPGRSVNNTILRMALDNVGHRRSAATVQAALQHLVDVGAVATQAVGPLTVATLTQAGLDAAEGRSSLPGVRQPQPGESV